MPLHFEKKNTLRSVDFNNEKGTHIFNFGCKAALVAQSVERRSHNPKVASSILARRAHICHSSSWFFFPFFMKVPATQVSTSTYPLMRLE